jgi:hypothetical protein
MVFCPAMGPGVPTHVAGRFNSSSSRRRLPKLETTPGVVRVRTIRLGSLTSDCPVVDSRLQLVRPPPIHPLLGVVTGVRVESARFELQSGVFVFGHQSIQTASFEREGPALHTSRVTEFLSDSQHSLSLFWRAGKLQR